MTANVITYRGKLRRAREAGKVLGFDQETLGQARERWSPMWGWKDPNRHRSNVQFREAGFDLNNPRIRKFLDLHDALAGFAASSGPAFRRHGRVPGRSWIPSCRWNRPSMPDRVVVQWDKEDCADMGIVKVDLLGLGMMAVLEGFARAHPRHYARGNRSRAAAAERSAGLSDAAEGRHGRHVPGGKPRADGLPAADASPRILRPRGAGGDHPARARLSAKWCIRI